MILPVFKQTLLIQVLGTSKFQLLGLFLQVLHRCVRGLTVSVKTHFGIHQLGPLIGLDGVVWLLGLVQLPQLVCSSDVPQQGRLRPSENDLKFLSHTLINFLMRWKTLDSHCFCSCVLVLSYLFSDVKNLRSLQSVSEPLQKGDLSVFEAILDFYFDLMLLLHIVWGVVLIWRGQTCQTVCFSHRCVSFEGIWPPLKESLVAHGWTLMALSDYCQFLFRLVTFDQRREAVALEVMESPIALVKFASTQWLPHLREIQLLDIFKSLKPCYYRLLQRRRLKLIYVPARLLRSRRSLFPNLSVISKFFWKWVHFQ